MVYMQDFNEFTGKFQHLATEGRVPIVQWKEELHDKLYDSLRVQMVDEVGDNMVDYHSYLSKATKIARKLRRAVERHREQRDSRKSSTNSKGGDHNQNATTTRYGDRNKDKATRPNTEKGKGSSGEKIETHSGSRAEQVTCHNRRKKGHTARNCAESKKSENKKVQQKDGTTPASADEADSATDENSENE